MSSFLLDTNVPSELMRKAPDRRVGKWLYSQVPAALYLSVVTVGEVRKGIAILPVGDRRTELDRWFEKVLIPSFSGRIIPVTVR